MQNGLVFFLKDDDGVATTVNDKDARWFPRKMPPTHTDAAHNQNFGRNLSWHGDNSSGDILLKPSGFKISIFLLRGASIMRLQVEGRWSLEQSIRKEIEAISTEKHQSVIFWLEGSTSLQRWFNEKKSHNLFLRDFVLFKLNFQIFQIIWIKY